MKKSGMFVYFNDAYYKVQEDLAIVVPLNADYKTNAMNSQIIDSVDLGVIDMYVYHSDTLYECNSDRVIAMKELLLGEKVTKIEDVNNDYVIGVSYELYNKEGQLLKDGKTSVRAIYHTAVIGSDVAEDNTMEYRKAMLFDGKIQIEIPEISRYGIKNKYVQHPFTVRITSITVSSTVGENYFCGEETTQLTADKLYSASHAHIIHVQDPHMAKNNFSSHFITNAHVGTTVIDQTVVPSVLEVDKEYTLIPLCEIKCDTNANVAKFNHKLKLIELNVEVLLDNANIVYNVDDIKEIIDKNNEPDEPIPSEPPVEEDDNNQEPSNPDDEIKEPESDKGETTIPDSSGENQESTDTTEETPIESTDPVDTTESNNIEETTQS